MCVCVHMCVRMYVYMRACVHACENACVCVYIFGEKGWSGKLKVVTQLRECVDKLNNNNNIQILSLYHSL